MTEHRIHLRRAWDDDSPHRTRIDLPTRWAEAAIPARIARSFNAPSGTDPGDIVSLEFAVVPGLISATLNDRALGLVREGGGPVVARLTELRPFGNRLVLTLDAAEARAAESWGEIALVIRCAGP
jgi:hypothetical protein